VHAIGATRPRRRGCSRVARREGRRGDCEERAPLRHSCATVDPRSTAVTCPARAVPPSSQSANVQGNHGLLSLPRWGSNPGSGTHKSPANTGLFRFLVVHSRTKLVENEPANGPRSARYWTLQDHLAPMGRSSDGRANRERGRVRRWPRVRGRRPVNYARRQQYRRLPHAGRAALGSVVAGLLGLVVASAGAAALGGLLVLTAVGLGFYARHWLSLAGRSRVGACSEDEVQRARSHTSRRRGGGFGTLRPGKAGGTSIRWRSPPPAWRSRSRPRPGLTTCVTSPVSMSRRYGCPAVGEGGAVTACWRSCASSEYAGCSASRTMSLSSQSIA
jgi:hypothetical protein